MYFPKASTGPGFFQVLSVYIQPSASVSLGFITGFHSGSIHLHLATRTAFSPVGRVWGLDFEGGKTNSSIGSAGCSVSSALM